jgi:hypothetical protein
VADDAREPMPGDVCAMLRAAGCRVVATDFNRKGNLNGTECAVGMLDTFRDAANAHGADAVIKLDPDMWLGSLTVGNLGSPLRHWKKNPSGLSGASRDMRFLNVPTFSS